MAAGLLAPGPRPARADFTWQAGPWGVVVSDGGTPGSVRCPVVLPNGTFTGNAVAVHYEFTAAHWPQLWVFLTDGTWRQTSETARFGTSYRWFGYYGTDDTNHDRLAATGMRVAGTNATGELAVETLYSNDSPYNDRFRIAASALLERPDARQTALRAATSVSNASGRAVTPSWQGHRILAEQWRLLHVVSMYVATDWSGGVPAWYDTIDPMHRYVGVLGDTNRMNDGYSLNLGGAVPTHDVKFVEFDGARTALDHDVAVCPPVLIPDYLWYTQLVVYGRTASRATLLHGLSSPLNHRAELNGCAGLVADPAALRWSVTYNRSDPNSVDGDNVQVRLGMDDAVDAWPADAVQSVSLRMVTGSESPAVTSLTAGAAGAANLAWTTEPAELYVVQFAPAPGGTWSNIVAASTNGAAGPLPARSGFYRIAESPAP